MNTQVKVLLDKYGRSKEDVARLLCDIADSYALSVGETFVWDELSEKYDFKLDDFFNDIDGAIKKYGDEGANVYGMSKWTWRQ